MAEKQDLPKKPSRHSLGAAAGEMFIQAEARWCKEAKKSKPGFANAVIIFTGLSQPGVDDLEGAGAAAIGGQHGKIVDELLDQPKQDDRPQCDGIPPPEFVHLLKAPAHRTISMQSLHTNRHCPNWHHQLDYA